MSIRRRLDAITHIPHLTETPPLPRSLKIELTSRCNYRCRYCSHSRSGDMPLDLFKRITDSAPFTDIGPFLIGEPFCSPDLLVQAIALLRSPNIFLTSNASLAFPGTVARCFEAGLTSLKWSVNFSDEQQFREMAHASPSLFHSALANIKAAPHQESIYASSILYNEAQREKMQPLLTEHILPYVADHYWLPLYSMGGAAADMSPRPGNPGRIDSPVPPVPCWCLFTAAHVRGDGTLVACPFGIIPVADLKEVPFADAWHAPAFRALRRAHISGEIRGTPCEACLT